MSSIKTKRGDTLIEVLLAVAVFSIIAVSSVGIMNHGLNRTQAALETTMARAEIDSQAEALRFIHDSYSSDKSFKKLWHYISGKVEGEQLDNSHLAYNDPNKQYNQDLTNCASAYTYVNEEGNSIYNKKAFVINPRKFKESMNEDDGPGIPEALVYSLVGNTPDTNTFQAAQITPRLIYANDMHEENDDLYGDSFDGYDKIARAEGIWVIAVESADKGQYTEDNNIEVPLYYDFYIQTCWDSPGSNTATNLSTTIRLHNPDAIQSPPDATEITVTYYANYPENGNLVQGNRSNLLGSWTGRWNDFRLGYCGTDPCLREREYKDSNGLHWEFDFWEDENGVPIVEDKLPKSNKDVFVHWKEMPYVCYEYKYKDDGSIFYKNTYGTSIAKNIMYEHCKYVSSSSSISPNDLLSSDELNVLKNQSGYVFKGWTENTSTNQSIGSCYLGSGPDKCGFKKDANNKWTREVYAYWAAKIDTMYGILAYPKVSSWIEVCNTIRVPFIGDRTVCIDELRRKLVDAYGAVGSEYAGFNDGPLFNRMENVNSGQAIKLLYPKADDEVAPFFEEKSDEDEDSDDYDTNTFARKHRILKLKINDPSFFGPIKEIFQKAETLGSVTLFRNLNYSNQPYYYSIFSYNYQYGRKIDGSEDVWLAVTLKGDGSHKYVSVPKAGPTNYNCWMVSAIRKVGDNRELVMFDNKLTNTDNGMTCAVQKDDALVNSKRAL